MTKGGAFCFQWAKEGGPKLFEGVTIVPQRGGAKFLVSLVLQFSITPGKVGHLEIKIGQLASYIKMTKGGAFYFQWAKEGSPKLFEGVTIVPQRGGAKFLVSLVLQYISTSL